MADWIGEKLSPGAHISPPLSLRLNKNGTALLFNKPLDYTVIFLREHGAGGIDQSPSRLQYLPHGFQKPKLYARQRHYVGFTAQQFDVRMAADNAAGTAGYVEENAVKSLAIPPLFNICGIRLQQAGVQIQPVQIFLNPGQARGGFINGDHFG